jgi:hypothetical protein
MRGVSINEILRKNLQTIRHSLGAWRIRDFNCPLIFFCVKSAHDLAGNRFSGTWRVDFQVSIVGLASPQSAANGGKIVGPPPSKFWDEKDKTR